MRKWVVPAVVPALGGGLLLGLLALGYQAREPLRTAERYTIAFLDIDPVPAGPLARETFLGEVQYLAGLPDRLDLLDAGLAGRLARAFADHPWVERVQRVELLPPREVRVRLVFRTAVLAVPVAEKGASVRVVDRHGVLLPRAAGHARLPLLAGPAPAPPGPPGSPWGDERVEAAAATAALLQPYQERLHLEEYTLEVAGGEIILRAPGVRVRWGRAPGQEQDGEAPAATKVQRLLDHQARHQGATGAVQDLRPLHR